MKKSPSACLFSSILVVPAHTDIVKIRVEMGRAPCCSKVGLHRGPWTAREDLLLTKFIEAYGEGQWRALPKKAGLLRCGKSCRLRWMNYLRPDIKRGNITVDEEELIIRLHKLLGNRWSLIAGRLPGRTDNEIKNFWNTHLSKKLMMKGIDPKTHKPAPERVYKPRRMMKESEDQETDSMEHCMAEKDVISSKSVQPIQVPKPNRYISFPRHLCPSLTNSDVQEVLLSPSIDLNSPCKNLAQASLDSDHSSSGMLSNMNPIDELDHEVSNLPQQAGDPEDCFPWACIEDWPSEFQPAEAKCISNEGDLADSENNHIIPAPQTKACRNNKPENCPNTLQKIYEEYLQELLQDDTVSINAEMVTKNNGDGQEINIFPEGISSVWEHCLEGAQADELLNDQPASETLSLHL